MRAPRIFRTLAFRIVAVYLAVFALSAAAIVAFTYWSTARALNAQTDQIVGTDISGLAELYALEVETLTTREENMFFPLPRALREPAAAAP